MAFLSNKPVVLLAGEPEYESAAPASCQDNALPVTRLNNVPVVLLAGEPEYEATASASSQDNALPVTRLAPRLPLKKNKLS
jgi:hypothetical protein